MSLSIDPVIEHYKKSFDRTMLRENLKLTVQARFERLIEMQALVAELRRAGQFDVSRRPVAEANGLGRILVALSEAGVEYMLTGETAGVVHGSMRTSLRIQISYRDTPSNVARLAMALVPFQPRLRDAPEASTFKFATSVGYLDASTNDYGRLLPGCFEIDLFGYRTLCVGSIHRRLALEEA
ncbi:MAG TPA: hypothetical protein VH083_10365 [Myxococcales bacterium]|jgi:hypothetical protein|nr:hypothetical protein [Myxococcales bacterium]